MILMQWGLTIWRPPLTDNFAGFLLQPQVLKTGFFHADPHPGNLAIDEDASLIYYDFGMMGEINSLTREILLDLFYAVYEKDVQKVCFCLLYLPKDLLFYRLFRTNVIVTLFELNFDIECAIDAWALRYSPNSKIMQNNVSRMSTTEVTTSHPI